MNVAELKKILSAGESQRAEFKKTTGQRIEAARTVCAMLNGEGGYLVFGALDNGVLAGQEIGQRTLEEVHNELAKIDPPAFPDVSTVPLSNGKSAIIISVQGGGGPFNFDNRPYVRYGPTTRVMPKDLYERRLLEKMHGNARWENQVAVGVTLSHLDSKEIILTVDEAIRRHRLDEPGTRDLRQLLIGMGLMKGQKLLNAAVVLFGKPSIFLPHYPQCLLRLARFRGREKSEMVDSKQEQGNAFDLFQRAQRFLRDHLPVASKIHPDRFEREDIPAYPTEALREALANALVHRDYSMHGGSIGVGIFDDRLEIESTGMLPFGLTPEALYQPHSSLLWNPIIATVFYRRALIEKWGRGTLRMASLMRDAGLEIPEIECSHGCVRIRFRRTRYEPPTRIGHNLSDLQRRLLTVLAKRGPATLSDILENLTPIAPKRTIQFNLQLLREFGLLESIGKTGVHFRWMLKET